MTKNSFFTKTLLAGLLSFSALFANPGNTVIQKIEKSSDTPYERTLDKREIESFDPVSLEETTRNLQKVNYRNLDRDVSVKGFYRPKKKVKELVRFNDTYFSDRQISNLKLQDAAQFEKDVREKARELGYDLNRATLKEFIQFEADVIRKYAHYDWEQCVETTGIGADVNNDGRADGIKLGPLSKVLIENPSTARKLKNPDSYIKEIRRKKDDANKTPVDVLFRKGKMDILCRHIASLTKNMLEVIKDDNPNLANVYSILARNEIHAWNLFLVDTEGETYAVSVDLTQELVRKGTEYVIDYSDDNTPEIFSRGIYFALIADLYRTNNFPSEAVKVANIGLKHDTESNDEMLLYRASCNIQLGNLEAAKDDLTKIVDMKKDGLYSNRRYKALFDLADVHRKLGNDLEEFKIYEKFISDAKKQNKESTLPDALFYNVGENYYRRGKYKDAEEQFDFNLRRMSRYREENLIMLACSQLYTNKERSASSFRKYLEEFPSGQFVQEAREGLEESK